MAANPYFEIQGGADKVRFELEEPAVDVVVGRSSECQWAIPSSGVSRRHARISRRGSEVTIEDIGSSNGTFVNTERLSAPRPLRDQDLVRLGSVEIRFVVPAPEASVDATIALQSASPPPPPVVPPAEPSPPPQPPAPPSHPPAETGSTTRSVTPPLPAAGLPPASAPSSAPISPPDKSVPAPREAAPPWLSASDDGAEPTVVELIAIATGSFLAVFALGALLIRFLF
jgi:predicted component of type VI protein secretion system